MESLSELMARPDVQYQIQKKVIRAKQEVVQQYAMRVNSFYHSFSYHWVFHKKALRILQQDYEITQRQFEFLMGAYALSNAWDCGGVIGVDTLYELFFEGEIEKRSLTELMMPIKKAGLIASFAQNRLTAKNRIKIEGLKKKDERMIILTDLAMEIPRRYNTIMGQELTSFAKQHGKFRESLIKIINHLLKFRKHLVGSNKDLLKTLDKALIDEANSD